MSETMEVPELVELSQLIPIRERSLHYASLFESEDVIKFLRLSNIIQTYMLTGVIPNDVSTESPEIDNQSL